VHRNQGIVAAAIIGFIGAVVAAVLPTLLRDDAPQKVDLHVEASIDAKEEPAWHPGTVHVPPGQYTAVRSAPSVSAAVVGQLPSGASVRIKCTAYGDYVVNPVNGYGSNLWNKIESGYVPDAHVYTGTNNPTMPAC
jgi:hypothetical protein